MQVLQAKLGIGKVDEFIGKLLDIGAESGILYGFIGVTEPARLRAENARNPKVSIRDLVEATRPMREFSLLPAAELVPHNWAAEINQALGFGQCDNPHCFEDQVTFSEWPGGEMAGFCGSCGTFNILCSECDATLSAEIGENTCYSCGTVYEVGHDGSGDHTTVTRVEPEEESGS